GFEGELTHVAIEELFKPKITVFYDHNKIANKSEFKDASKYISWLFDSKNIRFHEWDYVYGEKHSIMRFNKQKPSPEMMKIWLLSDGDKVYMKRLD
ncbi:MAG: hypothetical protein ABIB43_01365, partial [archaeon]